MALRFHWRPLVDRVDPRAEAASAARASNAGIPHLDAEIECCRSAEALGFDSILTAFGYYLPDTMLLAATLGLATERIKFIVAYRPGLMSPTLFVQQVNTLSALLHGRVSLNIVAGHSAREQRAYGDSLGHDERYERANEFMAICRAFWDQQEEVGYQGKYYTVENGEIALPFVASGRIGPEIYIGGGSPQAQHLALRHGTCWLMLADAPEALRPRIEPVLLRRIEVCLRLSVIARPSREEALEAAYAMVTSADSSWVSNVFQRESDSVSMKAAFGRAMREESHWLTPNLWNGAVPTHGSSAIALVGTPDEIAAALLEYKQAGITQFILSGWPNLEAVDYFGNEVLPRVRAREHD